MSSPDAPDHERYRRIAHLFHQALELSPDARRDLIATVRANDASLASEVESLLGAHGRAADFIERPALSGVTFASSPSPIAVPREPIGHYRILQVIGQGGMGVVYLAEDTRLGRTLALKAVRPEFAGDETRTARLRREARAAAALVHPNIATVYALEEIDGRLYLASEFVGGESLRDELGRGPLAPSRVVHIALAVLHAIDAASQRGIVHRDLKPENVVTTTAGDVKVLDFGLAQVAEADGTEALTKEGAALGTPAYMSPEQIRGEAVDTRSDLFAWGVLVVELITGRHPFLGATPAATIARVLETPAAAVLANANTEQHDRDPRIALLLEFAGQCLSKSASARPLSAADLLASLEAALTKSGDGRLVATAPASPAPPARVSGGRRTAWWWEFHQVATTASYVLLLIPLWQARTVVSPEWGRRLFLAGLVAAIVSVMLRMHLWFARKQYPGEWATDHHTARRVARAADTLFALVLATCGLMLVNVDERIATLLIAAAASVVVSFAIIEPSTTKAMG